MVLLFHLLSLRLQNSKTIDPRLKHFKQSSQYPPVFREGRKQYSASVSYTTTSLGSAKTDGSSYSAALEGQLKGLDACSASVVIL
ncbi:hypothetical protein H5410_062383 [Solanum commersonii]|uniref:Uncharacterized protein n=1 Tax=Solanum commersonii TaxID=4109 RepID=A0A9J5WAH5_SOLCO|nr:hypothetical protein H5410_062383 [Solanum commersonii]